MSVKPFAVFPEIRPRALNVVGERLTVLASKEATHGYEIFLLDGTVPPLPPPRTDRPMVLRRLFMEY